MICFRTLGIGVARQCTLLDYVSCVATATAQYVQSNGPHDCKCKPQCYSNNYPYTLAQSALSGMYQDALLRAANISAADQSRNIVMVQIYYSTLMYSQITVSAAYSFIALLSDIGGALGLLLGATLLTVYEMGEFCYEVIRDVVRLGKKRRDDRKGIVKVEPYPALMDSDKSLYM